MYVELLPKTNLAYGALLKNMGNITTLLVHMITTTMSTTPEDVPIELASAANITRNGAVPTVLIKLTTSQPENTSRALEQRNQQIKTLLGQINSWWKEQGYVKTIGSLEIWVQYLEAWTLVEK